MTLLAPLDLTPGLHSQALTFPVPGPEGQQNVRMELLCSVPGGYPGEPGHLWPLVIGLHGSYQVGNDLDLLAGEGIPALLKEGLQVPALVLCPQFPAGLPAGVHVEYDWGLLASPLLALVDRLVAEGRVDPDQVSLTGFSMGGFGAWELALAYPERFSALAPVAGGWTWMNPEIPEGISRLAGVPVWAFHGADDPVVPSWQAEGLVEALRATGGQARLTLYPDGGHQGAWDRAYRDPTFWTWLTTVRRP